MRQLTNALHAGLTYLERLIGQADLVCSALEIAGQRDEDDVLLEVQYTIDTIEARDPSRSRPIPPTEVESSCNGYSIVASHLICALETAPCGRIARSTVPIVSPIFPRATAIAVLQASRSTLSV